MGFFDLFKNFFSTVEKAAEAAGEAYLDATVQAHLNDVNSLVSNIEDPATRAALAAALEVLVASIKVTYIK